MIEKKYQFNINMFSVKFIYTVIVLSLIVLTYKYSNKNKFHYQSILHVMSAIFIYDTVIKSHKSSPCIKSLTPPTQLSNNALETCLQDVCSKSVTRDECEKYKRCDWDPKGVKCHTKFNLCQDLNTDQCNSNTDCKMTQAAGSTQNRCQWKNSDDDHKIGLNKLCFKTKNTNSYPPNVSQVSPNDFVHDINYDRCIKKNTDTGEPTQISCQVNSAKKLLCESTVGYKFDIKKNNCNRFYSQHDSHETQQIAHEHNNRAPPKHGFKQSTLYKIENDESLAMCFKSILIMFVLLVNFGLIKIFKSF